MTKRTIRWLVITFCTCWLSLFCLGRAISGLQIKDTDSNEGDKMMELAKFSSLDLSQLQNTTTTCPVDHCLILGQGATEQYPNLIMLRPLAKEYGGLLDRLSVARYVLDLGAMLCARVALAKPSDWLSTKHNSKHVLSPDVTWQRDFFETTFRDTMHRNENRFSAHKSFPRKVDSPFLSTEGTSHQDQTWHARMTGDERNESSMDKIFVHRFFSDKFYTPGTLPKLFQILLDLKKQKMQEGLDKRNSSDKHVFVWTLELYNPWSSLGRNASGSSQADMIRMVTGGPGTTGNDTRTTTNSSLIENNDDYTLIQPFIPDELSFSKKRVPFEEKKIKSCGSYVKFHYSKLVHKLARSVLREAIVRIGEPHWNATIHFVPGRRTQREKSSLSLVQPQLLHFGVLHLRRGDALHLCDTSIRRMQRYITCSMGGNKTQDIVKRLSRESILNRKSHPFVMFFATNEKNRNYRRQILRMLSHSVLDNEGRPLIHAIDLDQLIAEVFEVEMASGRLPIERYTNNNYSIFWVGKLLAQMAWFRLIQRQHILCDSCNIKWVEEGLALYQRVERDAKEYANQRVNQKHSGTESLHPELSFLDWQNRWILQEREKFWQKLECEWEHR